MLEKEMGLTMKERQSVTRETACRYATASRKEKTVILNEFIELTGYNRKYAINLLRSCIRKRRYRKFGNFGKDPHKEYLEIIETVNPTRKKRVYKTRYDKPVITSLGLIWEFFNFMCGQRLVPFIRENIDSLCAHKRFRITYEVREKLLTISCATVNRLLSDKRKERSGKGISTTKAAGDLSRLIPIRTFFDWDERIPGFFETDTVSHDGGNAFGEHCFTVTVTDVCTGWTELRAVINKAQRWVKEAVEDVRNTIPYRMKGIDSDNGSEFKNYQLLSWCQQNGIEFTRSRSYRKNDNCFVEQKNDSTVRHLVGYFRYEGQEATDALNRLYGNWCLLVNYFYPSVKILAKERRDAHTYKQYDKARTPFARTMDNESIPQEVKDALADRKAKLDLVEIKIQVEKDLDIVLAMAKPWNRTVTE